MIGLISILLSLSSANPFSLNEVYVEMSMDTYPYGIDVGPLIKTIGDEHPIIDSLAEDCLFGTIDKRALKWNEKGECVSPLCKPNENLTWSDYWKP